MIHLWCEIEQDLIINKGLTPGAPGGYPWGSPQPPLGCTFYQSGLVDFHRRSRGPPGAKMKHLAQKLPKWRPVLDFCGGQEK